MALKFKGWGPKYHYCKKIGHIQKNCLLRIKDERKAEQDGPGMKGKKRDSKSKSTKHDTIGLVMSHVLGASEPTSHWIMDSGATCHICNSKELFEDFHPLQVPQQVTVGDGRKLEAVGTGVVPLKLKLLEGEFKIGRLSDILYVPKLAYNLLSVPRIMELGKEVIFDELQGHILDDQGELVALASKTRSLYYLNCEPLAKPQINAVSDAANEKLWHRRLGHLSERSLHKLVKDELVSGLNYNILNEIDFCESCVNGKICRSSFPLVGWERAEEPLGLVHSDICGKLNSPSLGGAEYFITFIDDKTHYVWIYALKNKHKVFQTFREWKSLVEKSTGHKLKTFRTDNGGEFTSTEFESYLREEGIKHEYTIPKTPQQNWVSERMNRTLVEAVRLMLVDAKLPHRFWAEALSTAAYLINGSPTKTLGDKTPFEVWYGKKPSVKHLKVFGCAAYSHVAKDERKKLDSKTKKCIFLGYAAQRKGYCLYDTEKSSIVFSRDVVFNESSTGIEIEQEEKRPIQIETFSEQESEWEENSDQDRTPDEDETEPHPEKETDQVHRRNSTREVRRSDYYGAQVYVTELQNEPKSVEEALFSAEEKWKAAMQKEMDSIYSNDVWDLVELPTDCKPVGSKWVFKQKTNADGSIDQYKARFGRSRFFATMWSWLR